MAPFGIVLFSLAFLVFCAVVGARMAWRVKQRGIESPVVEKMLRPPGHSLRLRIIELEENTILYLLGCFGLPLLVATVPLLFISFFEASIGAVWGILAVSGVLAVLGLWMGAKCAQRRVEQTLDHELGYRGELLVAEFLKPLEREGYRVYHDFPLQQVRKDANIDHIVVGKTGVWVVETKMRRKHRKVKTTQDNFKVEFTGDELVYPTFRDRHGIDQTEGNARHLQEFLQKETGKTIPVSGLLVLPGWYVQQSGRGRISATSHKAVANWIDRGRLTLGEELQRDAARAIEKVCRDVKV